MKFILKSIQFRHICDPEAISLGTTTWPKCSLIYW